MKHKFVYYVETKKKGVLGIPRKVREKKTIYVDDKTYKKLKQEWNSRSYSVEEMILYDLLDGD